LPADAFKRKHYDNPDSPGPTPTTAPGATVHLFFDTETTGIPRNYKAPASDLRNWPRLVQIAWLLVDEHANEVASAEHIIRPDGFTIPADAAKVHGITTEMAVQDGVDLAAVLAAVASCIDKATALVAHNVAFDEKILGAEFLRAGHSNLVEAKKRKCTMQGATNHCRLPGRYGYKWPTLSELHMNLFNEPLKGAHRALVDVRACARCYFELRRLKVMH
jgi:DNA polymerase III epsilon subunit-like protein